MGEKQRLFPAHFDYPLATEFGLLFQRDVVPRRALVIEERYNRQQIELLNRLSQLPTVRSAEMKVHGVFVTTDSDINANGLDLAIRDIIEEVAPTKS